MKATSTCGKRERERGRGADSDGAHDDTQTQSGEKNILGSQREMEEKRA